MKPQLEKRQTSVQFSNRDGVSIECLSDPGSTDLFRILSLFSTLSRFQYSDEKGHGTHSEQSDDYDNDCF